MHGVIEAGSGLVAPRLLSIPLLAPLNFFFFLLNGGLFRTRCASNASCFFFFFSFSLRTIITGLLHSREAGEKETRAAFLGARPWRARLFLHRRFLLPGCECSRPVVSLLFMVVGPQFSLSADSG